MKSPFFKVPYPLVLAPMDEITDVSCRLICRRRGANVVFSEFTSCEALIRSIPKALKKLNIEDEERPIAIQIFGGKAASMVEAARIAETFNPDAIDINCGCWNRNHSLRGECAGLLRDLPRLERILKAVARTVRIPITVKTRLGWDANNIIILDLARMVEQAGVSALTVHCRTRAQGYKGKADWSWLREIKKVISIPLIGNGDVKTPEDVRALFELGCDGVMIGREALSNPWIFHQSQHYLKAGEHLKSPSLTERIEGCLEHLKLSVRYRGQREGVIRFRKYYAGYLRGLTCGAKLRDDLMKMTDADHIIEKLYQFERKYSRESQQKIC